MVLSSKQRDYYSSLKGKQIKSRGIPSDEQLWLPRHDKVREILNLNADPFDEYGASWELEDVMMFVFPKDYQETYHIHASDFMSLLLSHPEGLYSTQIGEWVRTSGVSKATFYNRILPRLKRIGMVAAEREAPRKNAGYILKPSLTFHNYLFKIAKEWQRHVKTARAKKPTVEE
jgi:hypothetical protein